MKSASDIYAEMKTEHDTSRRERNAKLGPKRIICLTTNGGSREDGNVYYAWHLLVESNRLNFDEPIFDDPKTDTLIALGIIDEDDSASDAMPKYAQYLRDLGYIVHDVPTQIITIGDDF